MEIEDLVLKQTCECCPEQYDVIYNGERIGYIRYRSGLFTCQPVIENEITPTCYIIGFSYLYIK